MLGNALLGAFEQFIAIVPFAPWLSYRPVVINEQVVSLLALYLMRSNCRDFCDRLRFEFDCTSLALSLSLSLSLSLWFVEGEQSVASQSVANALTCSLKKGLFNLPLGTMAACCFCSYIPFFSLFATTWLKFSQFFFGLICACSVQFTLPRHTIFQLYLDAYFHSFTQFLFCILPFALFLRFSFFFSFCSASLSFYFATST
jgi:hypothetical protein